jgi:hypothetical protein
MTGVPLRCPACNGELRVVGCPSHTLMAGDNAKHPHLHDPNQHGMTLRCACGLGFALRWWTSCPVDGCGYNGRVAGEIALQDVSAPGPRGFQ